jgi:hypothetical protein
MVAVVIKEPLDGLENLFSLNKRSEKHLNNLNLLGGTHYESDNSSCERDISFSGKISF